MGSDHRNASGIFLLNLFLGWTLVGWVIALVWAVSNDKSNIVTVNDVNQTQNNSKSVGEE